MNISGGKKKSRLVGSQQCSETFLFKKQKKTFVLLSMTSHQIFHYSIGDCGTFQASLEAFFPPLNVYSAHFNHALQPSPSSTGATNRWLCVEGQPITDMGRADICVSKQPEKAFVHLRLIIKTPKMSRHIILIISERRERLAIQVQPLQLDYCERFRPVLKVKPGI